MSSSRQGNDRKSGQNRGPGRRSGGGGGRGFSPSGELIWGWHAAVAALANPERGPPHHLWVTPERAKALTERFGPKLRGEVLDNHAIAQKLPPGAVHQGIALDIAAPPGVDIRDLARPAKGIILMLDQVTDPQNVGAILRSAAAFGAKGVVMQDRHAPALAGALAKAAAGAADALPVCHATNLSRALEALADAGWRAVGLAGEAEHDLDDVLDGGPTVLVLGSEGEGIRRLVAEHCDVLARIPMPGGFESLNVSAAAAVALYAASRRVRT